MRESSLRTAREIAARESSAAATSAGADQRDFEGPFGERLRAGAHSAASVTLRAPAAGPPPARGDERGAWKKKALASLILRRAFQRRPGFDFGGPAGACRRGRRTRRRGGSITQRKVFATAPKTPSPSEGPPPSPRPACPWRPAGPPVSPARS